MTDPLTRAKALDGADEAGLIFRWLVGQALLARERE
jgi:hypothetical protein